MGSRDAGDKVLAKGKLFSVGGQCVLTVNFAIKVYGMHVCWMEGGEETDGEGRWDRDREAILQLWPPSLSLQEGCR